MKIKCTVMLLAVLLVVSGIPAVAGAVTAADEISVLVDGKPIVFDVAPRIVNDRTLVPLRAIFEEMGAVVEWDAATRIVNATKGDTVVVLALNDTSPTINGEPVTIDQPAIIVDGRTLAPLRFVAEAFGGTVDWNEPTLTASILTGKAGAETPPDTPAKAPGGGLVVSGGAASGTAVSA
ncbi:MAG: copper amine oxidase N-terminal domain-containing protein, partial [Clostridiales bacterium]|nr:copper amine oxidase N-terminal domain-containing protein [Clostridiales bacterium]